MCLPVWLVTSGSPDVSNSFVFSYSNSFVSQVCWWCPALRVIPIFWFPLLASLACGVRLSACLQFICIPKQFIVGVLSSLLNRCPAMSKWWCPAFRMSQIELSPITASLACGIWLSTCLQFICLPLRQFICLPVWLVASGSPAVSNSFVSPYSNSFVS